MPNNWLSTYSYEVLSTQYLLITKWSKGQRRLVFELQAEERLFSADIFKFCYPLFSYLALTSTMNAILLKYRRITSRLKNFLCYPSLNYTRHAPLTENRWKQFIMFFKQGVEASIQFNDRRGNVSSCLVAIFTHPVLIHRSRASN